MNEMRKLYIRNSDMNFAQGGTELMENVKRKSYNEQGFLAEE